MQYLTSSQLQEIQERVDELKEANPTANVYFDVKIDRFIVSFGLPSDWYKRHSTSTATF